MKQTLILIALAVLLSGCGEPTTKSSGSGSATTASDKDQGTLIATVNGVPIYESRLQVYQPLAAPNAPRDDVIDHIIISELLAQKAEETGLLNDNGDLNEQLAIARQSVLGRAYADRYIANEEVSEQEVQNRYEEIKSERGGQKEYDTSHILLEDGAQAKKILAQLKKDISGFKDLAKEHSKDSGSGNAGGSLGWVNPQGVVPEFGKAMIESTVGEIYPEVVQSQFGWHILFVHNTRETPVPELTPELYDNIKQIVNRDKFSKHLDDLKAAAKIERP